MFRSRAHSPINSSSGFVSKLQANLRLGRNLKQIGAATVHILTALGAVLGLLALLAATAGDWARAFAWLGAALIVDGADGPLARALEVKKVLPRFSGEDLDHVVDYLTYVTVPAFIVAHSSIVPEELRLSLAAAIMLVSLYHFADTKSKTSDGYFVGFPAIWNVIILYCFVLGLAPGAAALLIGLCAVLTFVPLHWVHPFRVRRLRPVTFGIVLAWAAASVSTLHRGFPGSAVERLIFVIAALYVVAIGLNSRAKTGDHSSDSP